MRSGIAAALVALCLAPAAAAAPGDGALYTFTYRGWLGGIPVGTAALGVKLGAGDYRTTLDLEAGGIAGLLFGWRQQAMAQGRLGMPGEGPAAARYTAESRYRGRTTSILIAYGPDGEVARREIDPPIEETSRKYVPAALTGSTVDPVTAALEMGARLARGEGCSREIAVFDGRRRYDLVFAPDPDAAGDGVVCRLRVEPVAGFKPKQAVVMEEPARIRFARPIPDGPLVPASIEARTSIGRFVIRLVEAGRPS